MKSSLLTKLWDGCKSVELKSWPWVESEWSPYGEEKYFVNTLCTKNTQKSRNWIRCLLRLMECSLVFLGRCQLMFCLRVILMRSGFPFVFKTVQTFHFHSDFPGNNTNLVLRGFHSWTYSVGQILKSPSSHSTVIFLTRILAPSEDMLPYFLYIWNKCSNYRILWNQIQIQEKQK